MSSRTLRRSAGALGTLAAAAAVLWFLWLPNYRPKLQPGERLGIDVSHHQGEIDWQAVADDGIDFAFIKATEGGDWIDPLFADNWVQATDAGLDVSAYHFFRTCTDGVVQAENFLATVRADADLPLAIDIEGHGQCAEVVSDEQVRSEVIEMIDLIEAERGPIIFYVLSGFEYLEDITGSRQQWQRSLWSRPDNDDWLVWQYPFRQNVDGVQGGVDANVISAS